MVQVIKTPAEYEQAHNSNPGKLIVVDFTAKWCGPCKQIAPFYHQLSHKYPSALFLSVDVDELQSIAQAAQVRAMPTFHLYKNREKIEEVVGANASRLEALVQQHAGAGASASTSAAASSTSGGATIPGGHRDLSEYVEGKQVNCLNEDKKFNCRSLLDKSGYLLSDCDAQLLIEIPFNQTVKIHSIKISSKDKEQAPKTVKLYVNRTKLGFDEASGTEPQQELVLTEKDLEENSLINLKFVKFQKVSNLQIFIEDNQGGGDVTRVDSVQLFGSAEQTTNMKNLTKVQGE